MLYARVKCREVIFLYLLSREICENDAQNDMKLLTLIVSVIGTLIRNG